MKLLKLFQIKRARKYPIKRDSEGLSLRARSFELFEQGKRPSEVAEELKMKEATVFRYFRDWKRLGPNFNKYHDYVRSLFDKKAPDRNKNIELFAGACGISKEEFEAILSRPHGLRRFLTGKFYFPVQADVDHKKCIVLELAILMSDFVVKEGGKFGDVYFGLKRYMHEIKKYREKEDDNIREWNKQMEFYHAILAADIENERKGTVKFDIFKKEEIDSILRYEIKSQMKGLQKVFWVRIARLMMDGSTKEEAREKLYQELLGKCDLEVAKLFREFQDKVHPVKSDSEVPPKPPDQLQSSP
jgi:hypothetical protein